MLRGPLLTIVVSSLCALGCGASARSNAGGPDSGVPPAASLSVSPTSQRVVAGSSAVTLRATLVGASVPITWTLSGPGTLGASSGEQTTYTPPATTAAEAAVTVSASAGPQLRASVSITVVPSAELVVAGRVVGVLGNGLSGATVAIGGRTTLTDADGRFSISGVTPPYDLAIVSPGNPPMAGLYRGLTRPDPTLVFLFFITPGDANSGVVSGRISGGDPIPSDGELTGAVFASPEATGGTIVGSRDYSLPLFWFGPTTTIGTVHVLQWKSPGVGRLPTSYIGFGTVTAVRVIDDQTAADASVLLYDPGTASISGQVIAPAGATVTSKALALKFADHAILPLGADITGDTRFSFPVPANLTHTAVVTALAEFPAGAQSFRRESGIARRATDVSIAIPGSVEPSTPADGSTEVSTSTEFAWGQLAGGVHLAVFNGAASTPSYYVVTAETSTRIPDLTALGAALPPASRYSWFVVRYAPFASVDEYTGIGFLVPPVGSFEGSISATRGFTTR
ncbi:MAG TPA: carboxypeptidase-like regulatory domain-containing protein [Myxococcaceae bacterium]|nr:carboxypeptidase-like regulatory domain-containing protein [Myxococcaceae bacterium]